MSLAAITQNQAVVVPYKFVQDKGSAKTTEIYNSIRQEARQGTTYYCANCFWANGSLLEVVFRGTDAEKRRPHFAHTAQSSGQCVGSRPESEKHSTAKIMVADWLRDQGGSVTVEYCLNKNKEGRQRQPDVFAEFPYRVEAHEIQLARINGTQITDRTNDILSQLATEFPGKLAIVFWYLAPQNQRPENWGCFDFDRRHGYAIDFDEDTGAPEWHSYEPEFNAEILRQQAIDAAKKQQQLKRQQEEADRKERQERYRAQATREKQQAEEERRTRMDTKQVFEPGDIVRGAPGRASENWKGRVIRADRIGYRVHWDDRATHKDPLVRRQPELFMLSEQLRSY